MKTSFRILLGLSRVGAVLALATSVGGCVAAKHYDEARSVAEAELAAHARTRARLAAALARAEALEKELGDKQLLLSEKEQELDAGQSAVAASKLETTVAVTEKRAAGELVNQLRSELARTGDHLRAYAGEKRDVEQALAMAEERIKSLDAATKSVSELIAVARDVAAGLGSELGSGGAMLGLRDGALVLDLPSDELFEHDTSGFGPNSYTTVSTLATVLAAHPGYALSLPVTPGDTIGNARSKTLQYALIDRGAPAERITFPSDPDMPVAPAPVADAAAPSPPASADAKDAGRGDAPAPAQAPAPAARYEIVFVKL